MHYAYITWYLQAIIFISISNNYTAYNQQAVTFQSQAFTYTTYNLQKNNISITTLHPHNL